MRKGSGHVRNYSTTWFVGRRNLALLPTRVGGNIPVVAKRVSDSRGTFSIIHLTHLVEAHCSGLQRTGIGRVRIGNIEVEGRGHCLPLARGPAGLDDAAFDAKGCVHGLSVVSHPLLLSQLRRSKRFLREFDELGWVLDGDERGHHCEPWRDV